MKDEKKVEQNNEETIELFGGKENLDKIAPWDFISAVKEAQDEAMKEGIRANTIMINSRLAKVEKFVAMITPFLGAQVPPMICGLEAKLADDLPEEFAFAVTEAPKTERERLIEELKAERDEWKKIARKIAEIQTGTDCCYGCHAKEIGRCDGIFDMGSEECVETIIRQAIYEIDKEAGEDE